MIDFELNFIKSIGLNLNNRKFGLPYGLTFSNGYLFVHDIYEKMFISSNDPLAKSLFCKTANE